MAPKFKKAPPKNSLRSYFGKQGPADASNSSQSASSQPRLSTQGSVASRAIEISEDEDTSPTTTNPPSSSTQRSLSPKRVSASSGNVAGTGTLKRKKAAVLLSSDEEEEVKPPKGSPGKKKASLSARRSVASSPPESESEDEKPPVKKKKTAAKRAADSDDDDFEPESEPKPEKVKASPAKKTKPAKRAAKDEEEPPAESKSKASSSKKADPQADSPKQEEKKFNWAAAKAARSAGPAAPGSKPVPEPQTPDCLAGLTFVFTGELSSFSRDEATDLAKRFGGRVTGQPSSKTDFVILGDNAGPSKIRAIQKNNLKTLNEDEFLNLVGTRVGPSGQGGKLDEKIKKKMEKEAQAIRDAAKEMEEREKKEVKTAKKEAKQGKVKKEIGLESKLWTDRYAPKTLKEVCGNKSQVEKLQKWLHDWESSRAAGFKKPGKDGMNVYRAILITGPPGIGKTTSAHLCAKLEGFTPIELNASDARSKKLIENSTNINNTSLDGWMGGGEATNAAGVHISDKSCLIMDEVDGMSAGDRGGVGALNALIKKTRIPIICIANDRGAMKLKPLMNTTFSLAFKRPDAGAVRSRILSIAYKEKMNIPAPVIDQLINGSQSDIRQVLNMLSTWKLSSDTMDFDEGKALSKLNEKYTIMTPFNVISKVFGPYTFSPTSRETLGEKMEYYFHDHQFMGLFTQENYLKTQPAKLRNLADREKTLENLRLMDRAASSISDGDLVDNMIHGPEQHWSLMPLHSVCAFVRPASFLYGGIQAYGGSNAISFPQWLGQNSKQNKLQRQLGDLQIRMRLKVSGDKAEIRQSYIPALFPHAVRPLMEQGASAVDDVISFMDEYYISRDDWDTLVELGVDDHKDDMILKKISTATKTSFTKKYNGAEHPIPSHKATDLGKAPKKLPGTNAAPDVEDAFDLDDDDGLPSENEKDESDDDISKDKLVQAKKPKGKAGEKPKAKGKGKK